MAVRNTQQTSSLPIEKRTHDDVCWKNTEKPWRRSGVYLSARVALQIVLHNSEIANESHSFYKNFMLYLLCRLAKGVMAETSTPDVLHVMRVKLARRNAKLGSDTFPFVQKTVHQTLQQVNDTMQSHWQQVIAREDASMTVVPVAEVSPTLMLKNSHSILQKIWQRSKTNYSYSIEPFIPEACVEVRLQSRTLPGPEVFDKSGDLLSCLVGVEKWVADNLTSWSASSSLHKGARNH